MRFNADAQKLFEGLTNATRAISARPPLQILEGVLVVAAEDEVSLMCSDGAMSIRATVQAEVQEEGQVVLPGKLFTEMIRKLPQGAVTFSLNERMMATIRCGSSRSSLSGLRAEDFPPMKQILEANTLHLPQRRLRDMINHVAFAIAPQETRQMLTGCLMEVTRQELRLVALDGFRLALQQFADDFVLPDGLETIKAVIPGRVISELGRMLSDEDGEMVTFHIDPTHLQAQMGPVTLLTSLLVGEYINYRQILPTEWKTRITVRCAQLRDAVDRASLMAREGKNNLIRMNATDGEMIITSVSEVGDVYERLEIDLQGDGIDVAFNARYIADVVKNIDEELTTLSLFSSVSPCVIRPTGGDQYLYLVLPVRVS